LHIGLMPQTEGGGLVLFPLLAAALLAATTVVMIVMVMVVVMMTMIMVVIVVMVVIVMSVIMIAIRVGVKHLRGHLLFLDLGQFKDEVHRLVLEDGRSELGEELRVVAVVLVDLPLLARKLPHALKQRAADLFVGDGDLIAGANFGEDQPKADASC